MEHSQSLQMSLVFVVSHLHLVWEFLGPSLKALLIWNGQESQGCKEDNIFMFVLVNTKKVN